METSKVEVKYRAAYWDDNGNFITKYIDEYTDDLNGVCIEEWYLDGKLHREDGPAIISGVDKEWWFNGVLHRLDGPAIDRFVEGETEWWVNGVQLSPEKENIMNIWYKNGRV